MDTSDIRLSDALLNLTEQLARHSHETWARQRTAEGWRHGPRRDDARKEHPCLVPYEDLPESEKQYDRNAALETLKAITACGYRIDAPDRRAETSRDARRPAAELARDAVEPLAGADPGDLASLLDLASVLALWRARNPERVARSPDTARRLGEQILKFGEPLLAYDVLADGLQHWPGDVRLRQLLALALARSGATERAHAVLVDLRGEGHLDEETLGLLARTHKDSGERAAGADERQRHLREAHNLYARAYGATDGIWPGINAATLAIVLGDRDGAAALARDVRARCRDALRRAEETGEDPYWILATLGEAALILGEWAEAEDCYGRAAQLARRRFGDLSSTRRNARLLMAHLAGDRERVERCFRIPRVVLFAGHMIDRPERPSPRFPPELEGPARAALRAELERLDTGFGYASAACGGDILFLEAVLERDGEIHVVLPTERSRHVAESVDIVPGAPWRQRFERILQRATEVVTASEQGLEGSGLSFDYAGMLLQGLARIRAEQLDADLTPLALWDGRSGDGPGGTAANVERWRRAGLDVVVVDLAELLRRHVPAATRASARETPRPAPAPPAAAPPLPTRMMAILFADAVNFSKLTEAQVPRFVQHFLGEVAALVAAAPAPPVMKNTWGDGLYFVFTTVRAAGRFALELCERVARVDWTSRGLPKELNLRIALHAGPVYACTDPVTGRPNYTGTHVSRAARIEPITPPGQVYASQAFAALAAADGVREFTCDYVGQTPLAKGYGTFPTYHVRRRAPAAAPRGRGEPR